MTPVIPCDFRLCLLPDFRMQRKIIIHLEIKNEKYIIPEPIVITLVSQTNL